MYKVLIIGYGSIAKKHIKSLKKIKSIKCIYLYSRRKIKYKNYINSYKEIIKINPDYFLITSETSNHYKYLKFIIENFHNKRILVEKPLFKNYKNLNIKNNKVFIGYNLRMHPVLQFVKKFINKKEIFYVNSRCESFLPKWRKDRNYTKSSSASKKLGGGVLLDLSHELDYLIWFFKDLLPKYVINSKISNLNISSDDFLLLIAKNKEKIHFNISLNYFSKIETRQLVINGKNFTIFADIIKNKIKIINQNKNKNILYKKFNISDTYLNMHKAILNNKFKNICNYSQGVKIMKLIERIRLLK